MLDPPGDRRDELGVVVPQPASVTSATAATTRLERVPMRVGRRALTDRSGRDQEPAAAMFFMTTSIVR